LNFVVQLRNFEYTKNIRLRFTDVSRTGWHFTDRNIYGKIIPGKKLYGFLFSDYNYVPVYAVL